MSNRTRSQRLRMVGTRIPADHWQTVCTRARRKGLSPSAYLRNLIARDLA